MFRYITFATAPYLNGAQKGCLSAHRVGARSSQIYTTQEIERNKFINALLINRTISWTERGAGYWIWKPAIILNEMKQMLENEVLIYADAGISLNQSIMQAIKENSENKILLWSLDQNKNELFRWTDFSVIKALGAEPKCKMHNMVLAGILVVPNNSNNFAMIEKWMELCNNPDFLCPDRKLTYQPSSGTIWHRHDQSLLTILTLLYPGHFGVFKYSLKSLKVANLPFVIHRNMRCRYVIIECNFERTKRVLRFFLSKFPRAIRIKVKNMRGKKDISELERSNHGSFH